MRPSTLDPRTSICYPRPSFWQICANNFILTLSSCSLYNKRCFCGAGPSRVCTKLFRSWIVMHGLYATTVLSPPSITTDIVWLVSSEDISACSGVESGAEYFGNRFSRVARHSRYLGSVVLTAWEHWEHLWDFSTFFVTHCKGISIWKSLWC